MRHLISTLVASGNYIDAEQSLDAYLLIVENEEKTLAKSHGQNRNLEDHDITTDVDSHESILRTMADGIGLLVKYQQGANGPNRAEYGGCSARFGPPNMRICSVRSSRTLKTMFGFGSAFTSRTCLGSVVRGCSGIYVTHKKCVIHVENMICVLQGGGAARANRRCRHANR
jgi:hypothetical protein